MIAYINLQSILDYLPVSVSAERVYHTVRAPNLRYDLITAKVSCVIPKQSDWSIMMS